MTASDTLIEHPRRAQAHLDETRIIAHLMQDRQGADHIMIDVGAHFGTSASFFEALGWTVCCFEPDPSNRAKLEARFGEHERVSIDVRAVAHKGGETLAFYTSEESTGISGLTQFRDSHQFAHEVTTTTVAEILTENSLDHIDFLKIDVEGFDFNVLKGVPWDTVKPAMIECEYEDAKTVPLGHNWKDIADFLIGHGYAVYISEWHPIIRYGIRHDWRRVVAYPDGPEVESASWGNILAFLDDPGFEAVAAGFAKFTKTTPPPPSPAALIDQESKPEERAPAKAGLFKRMARALLGVK